MKANRRLFYIIVLIFAGCTHTSVWEKTGGNQQSFDLDSRECEFIAQQLSLQQSETGKRIDPTFYNKAYIECITTKGWSKKTIAPEPENGSNVEETVQQLAESISINSAKGFGQTITVPDTYRLVANKRFQSGPTIIEQFFWKGEDSSFINILFQKNTAATFKKIPYPVSEPYVLYSSGKGDKAQELLQWTTFWGHIDSDWIMSTGAYYYASKKERIIIAITKPLVPPSAVLPQNVTLTRNQFMQIDEFSSQWQTWLNEQFTKGPGLLQQLIQALHFGKI
jgi:hypothetical protein